MSGPGDRPDPARADMERVGDYVRRALPQALLRNGTEWPTTVSWDESGVVAAISRGDLVLATRYQRERWWEPVGKATGDRITVRLGRVLWGYWLFYREADETGRLHVPLWRGADGALFGDPRAGAELVAATLDAGVRLGEAAGAEPRVHRLGEPTALTLREAAERGWLEAAG